MLELLPFGILEWCVRGIRRLVRGARARTGPTHSAETLETPGRAAWRQSKWMGACWLALGLTGLILVQPAIGWRSNDSSFWTDPGMQALDGPLRAEVVDWARERRPVGLAVSIVADGRVRRATLGHGRLMRGGPPFREALFEIGSITKTFTGILLARLAGDGRVSLDSRVSDLLPTGVELTPDLEAITLRHLATHTAGLPRLPLELLRPPGGRRPAPFYGTDSWLTAEPLTGALHSSPIRCSSPIRREPVRRRRPRGPSLPVAKRATCRKVRQWSPTTRYNATCSAANGRSPAGRPRKPAQIAAVTAAGEAASGKLSSYCKESI